VDEERGGWKMQLSASGSTAASLFAPAEPAVF
jgi:hypothetical protein